MRASLLVFFVIPLVLAVQYAEAQDSETRQAEQRLVEMTFDGQGNANVRHVAAPSDSQAGMALIPGDARNLSVADQSGRPQLVVSDGRTVTIMPSESHTIVTYDLNDAAVLINGMWTIEFRYPETTTFLFPEEVDLVFINDGPLRFEDAEGFNCHGCQLTLKYATDEPRNLMPASWEEQEFMVEVRTFAEIEDFGFSQPSKEISFSSDWDGRFVTVVIPQELLWGPYAVFQDDKTIPFNDYTSNGTHVWVNMKPDASGTITIVGTTVVPEFSIVAPLAAGFLAVLAVPLIRKATLR